MENLKLNINSEYGKLELVIVHNASTLVPLDQLDKVPYDMSYVEKELKFHPETADYDVDKLRGQINTFHKLLEDKGVSLIYGKDVEHAALQFFTRDIGFVVGDTFYFSVMKGENRKIEQKSIEHLKPILPKYVELTERMIEGGDVFVHGKNVFVGISRQTSWEGFYDLERHIGSRGYQAIAIPCDESVLHLDCRFNIASSDKAVMSREGIYPDGIKTLEKYFDITDVTSEELKTLGPNFFNISPKDTIVDKRNERLNNILYKQGKIIYELDFSEVIKLWGGFRCTILPLYRA